MLSLQPEDAHEDPVESQSTYRIVTFCAPVREASRPEAAPEPLGNSHSGWREAVLRWSDIAGLAPRETPAEFAWRHLFQGAELSIEVGEIAVAHCVGNVGDRLRAVDEKRA